MQPFTPCLWFDGNAEEAVQFYTSVFPNSKVGTVARFGEAAAQVSGQPEGSVMTIAFQLDGREFMALNGGPQFRFTQAISFVVPCETQEELDALWEKLSAGGSEEPCGWLQDRFGVSWQVVPADMEALMGDPARAERVMQALLPMRRIDIETLRRA